MAKTRLFWFRHGWYCLSPAGRKLAASCPVIRWLVPAEWDCQHPDAIAIESFGLGFTDLLCSVNAVITKPGYGTFTEAACNGTPVIYQRREDWPEQDCLIDWLQANGRCLEVDAGILQTGELALVLAQLSQLPIAQHPPASGSEEAACYLQSALSHSGNHHARHH
jgi:hypothetical protein